jgi:hypothetical protein
VNFDDILTDSSRKLADLVAEEIGDNSNAFKQLYDYTMLQKKQYAMRSSRVVSILAYRYPKLIEPYFHEMIIGLESLKDTSVKRNFLQIFIRYYWHENEETEGRLVNLCFDLYQKPTEPIAVRAYSLEILYRISKKIPEIKPELLSVLELAINELSGGLRGQATKIMKLLINNK